MRDAPTTPYFAFGSNLHGTGWAAHCAGAGVDPGVLEPGRAAWLPDHRPVYHYRSARHGGGALDVVPHLGDVVAGRLYAVGDGGWAALDDKEGHPRRYERLPVTVVDETGRLVRATTYRVTAARREGRFVPPTEAYVATVREGLRAAGHDPAAADRAARDASHEPAVRAVFVYGTLRRGGGAAHRLSALRPRDLAPATVPGRLYDLGAYPGLDPVDRGGTVHGELAFFDDTGPALATLDPYEDFGGWSRPDNLYHRVVVRARSASGTTHLAWAYALSARPDAPRLEDGVWPPRRR